MLEMTRRARIWSPLVQFDADGAATLHQNPLDPRPGTNLAARRGEGFGQGLRD